jgi:DNA-binding XRE family transcriptional regulator
MKSGLRRNENWRGGNTSHISQKLNCQISKIRHYTSRIIAYGRDRYEGDALPRYNHSLAIVSFGRQLREARIAAGLTQAELAARLGAQQATISHLEHGRANPSLFALERIARALNCILEVRLVPSPDG